MTIFGQYNSKLGQYKIMIRQNWVHLWDSTWWFFQQIKLNCGWIQVEIGTIQDNFRTVQVEIGTVQDNDSIKSSEIVGQYMMGFSTNSVELWVRTSWNRDSTRQFSDSTNQNWDSTRHRFDKIRWNFGTVQGDKFKLYKVNITNTSRWYLILEQDDEWANYWGMKRWYFMPHKYRLGFYFWCNHNGERTQNQNAATLGHTFQTLLLDHWLAVIDWFDTSRLTKLRRILRATVDQLWPKTLERDLWIGLLKFLHSLQI
jgi:hypothetical protein